MSPTKGQKRQERQLALRKAIWPEVDDKNLWSRSTATGFTNLPRTMPLILSIMDDMADGRPVSSVYLELWCRAFEEFVVSLSNATDLAFHAGFSGQRAERTWRERIRRLQEIGFINVEPGPAGELGYALILNPYKVIKDAYDNKSGGVRKDKYLALLSRATEIGAEDLVTSEDSTSKNRPKRKRGVRENVKTD